MIYFVNLLNFTVHKYKSLTYLIAAETFIVCLL